MADMQSDRARRAGSFGLLALFILVLTACSVTGSRIKAYDGPDPSRPATLEAPENIKVLSINGQGMTSFLLDDLSLRFSLKPGPNRVVYRYRSIWSRTGVRGNDEPAVDVIESDAVEATFDAQPDQTYNFAVDDARSIREARRLAKDFGAPIVNSSGDIVARSSPYVAQQGGTVAASSQSEPEISETEGSGSAVASESVVMSAPAVESSSSPGTASGGSESPAAADMSTLDALNLLWEQASPEEKEAFLRRAFE